MNESKNLCEKIDEIFDQMGKMRKEIGKGKDIKAILLLLRERQTPAKPVLNHQEVQESLMNLEKENQMNQNVRQQFDLSQMVQGRLLEELINPNTKEGQLARFPSSIFSRDSEAVALAAIELMN